jgi:hypothetical protein
MLTISIDRLDELLEQASDLVFELDLADEEDGTETAVEVADLADTLGDEPAYQRFAATLAGLTTEEVRELLALGLLARADASAEDWPALLEEIRGLPEETLRGELTRALLLSDDIETALERLGIFALDEAVEDDGDEDDEDDEEEDDDVGQSEIEEDETKE